MNTININIRLVVYERVRTCLLNYVVYKIRIIGLFNLSDRKINIVFV